MFLFLILLLVIVFMQCERLLKLTKSWYLKVRDETMAPARMISFMEQHIADCDVCMKDLELKEELPKIRELVLPESKIPKAVRAQQEAEDDDIEEEVIADEADEDLDDEDDLDDDEFADDDFDDDI